MRLGKYVFKMIVNQHCRNLRNIFPKKLFFRVKDFQFVCQFDLIEIGITRADIIHQLFWKFFGKIFELRGIQ